MKTFLVAAALLFAPFAFAHNDGWCGTMLNRPALTIPDGELLSLTLKELVDESVFQDSLSLEEYPGLYVTKTGGVLEIRIGASVFTDKKDDVTIIPIVYTDEYQIYEIIIEKDGQEVLGVNLDFDRKKGIGKLSNTRNLPATRVAFFSL
jgi:hypothetical protein